ncbi:hypothetical protein EB809_16105 [Marinobacter sp. R17]|uniref:hypothetical protein n=1 Tax=unclassified Marinobacter TaxID=83889 RepID=UPI000F4BF35E|nr:hypothetical protein [Marinobacter sp. R17]ROT97607.1 hypothetical protein EB809_16105 [Marinobacter sp. R17]
MSDVPVTSILVIASTSTVANAGSNMFVEVLIPQVAASEVSLPGSQGSTQVITMPASGTKTISEITPADINLSTEPPNEGDAWLPSAFYVLGKGDSGDYEVICAIPEWPTDVWLSEDPNDPNAYPAVTLAQVLSHV